MRPCCSVAGTRCTRCTPLSYFSLNTLYGPEWPPPLPSFRRSKMPSSPEFHPPALRFRVARVHAEKLAGEKRRFVAPGSGPNFHDDVLFIMGISGNQQHLQFPLDRFAFGFQGFFFVTCTMAPAVIMVKPANTGQQVHGIILILLTQLLASR